LIQVKKHRRSATGKPLFDILERHRLGAHNAAGEVSHGNLRQINMRLSEHHHTLDKD